MKSEDEYDADSGSAADDDSWLVASSSSESETEVVRYDVKHPTPTYAKLDSNSKSNVAVDSDEDFIAGLQKLVELKGSSSGSDSKASAATGIF